MEIEKKLEDSFRYVGIDFGVNEKLRGENLLGIKIGLKARDLLIIYLKIEKIFKIKIPEKAIVNGEFNTYWSILDIIKNEKGIK